MSPFVREVPLVPDVEALARALRGAPGAFVLASDPRGAMHRTDARWGFVACEPVETVHAWAPPDNPSSHAKGWAGMPAAPRWVGVVPYEWARAIERPTWTRAPDTRPAATIARPIWQRYDAVARIDHATGRVAIEADDARAGERLLRALAREPSPRRTFDLHPLPPLEPESAHAERVREVLRFIAAGDVYQVNLARAIDLELASGDPLDVFFALFRAAPAPYGSFVDFGEVCVASASPELALEVHGDRLRTGPIKGTRPRGADARTDAHLADALDHDPKERAELTMAVDLHRNDLGRVAKVGSVRALGDPRVVAGPTVWSRVAEVVAERAPGASLEAILRAVLPCGSVTGAPKVRAMEIIASLEPVRRGAYTGAIGYVGRDGAMVLAMGIRTLEIADRRFARFGTGGGIVEGSDPDRELDETRWKAAQIGRITRPSLRTGNLAEPLGLR